VIFRATPASGVGIKDKAATKDEDMDARRVPHLFIRNYSETDGAGAKHSRRRTTGITPFIAILNKKEKGLGVMFTGRARRVVVFATQRLINWMKYDFRND